MSVYFHGIIFLVVSKDMNWNQRPALYCAYNTNSDLKEKKINKEY